MKIRSIVFLFILLASVCHAQDAADSLKKAINAAPNDTNKVNALIDLSKSYLESDLDAALQCANQAKNIAEKLNFPAGKGWALKKVGQVYNLKSDYVNALEAWKEALRIFDENGIKVGSANMLNNIGVI